MGRKIIENTEIKVKVVKQTTKVETYLHKSFQDLFPLTKQIFVRSYEFQRRDYLNFITLWIDYNNQSSIVKEPSLRN